MEAIKNFCAFGGKKAESISSPVATNSCNKMNKMMACINYTLLLVYAGFAFFAIRIDPTNQIYTAVCIFIGGIMIGTFIVGNIGIFLEVDSAIRGTLAVLILEHIMGFVIGSLMLIESLTTKPLTTFHHASRFVKYFLEQSRPLAISLGCITIIISFFGCYSLSYVAECQTELAAKRYATDQEETEALIKKDLMSDPTVMPSLPSPVHASRSKKEKKKEDDAEKKKVEDEEEKKVAAGGKVDAENDREVRVDVEPEEWATSATTKTP